MIWWLFPWRTIRDTGVWLYQQHAMTGRRRAVPVGRGGYQPIDINWIDRRDPKPIRLLGYSGCGRAA